MRKNIQEYIFLLISLTQSTCLIIRVINETNSLMVFAIIFCTCSEFDISRNVRGGNIIFLRRRVCQEHRESPFRPIADAREFIGARGTIEFTREDVETSNGKNHDDGKNRVTVIGSRRCLSQTFCGVQLISNNEFLNRLTITLIRKTYFFLYKSIN